MCLFCQLLSNKMVCKSILLMALVSVSLVKCTPMNVYGTPMNNYQPMMVQPYSQPSYQQPSYDVNDVVKLNP